MPHLRLLLAACAAALPLLCTAAEPLPANVQQWPLRAVAAHPADVEDDFPDLAPLGAQLAQAQVVALGEQTHGASEEFRTKLRLLRYLHEKLGFDVLLLESGFYDMGRLSQALARGESLDAQAPGNVFFMYAKSAEGRELLRYVERQRKTLAFAGIDSQHSGELSRTTLLDGLQRAAAVPTDDPGWSAYRQRVLALIALNRQAPSDTEQAAFFAFNQRLKQTLCASETGGVDSPAWWCRVVASLGAQARSLWSNDTDYQRDSAMGANAIWLVDQLFKGRKAVIWAHIGHVAKGLQRDDTHLQAGEVMRRHWGDVRYQVVHFTTAAGSYLDFGDLKERAVATPPANSLEARLPAQTLLLKASTPLTLPQYGIDYRVDALPHPAAAGHALGLAGGAAARQPGADDALISRATRGSAASAAWRVAGR